MRWKQLRLQNFRCYSDVTLRPPSGVTVLVGPNGAGKTNLLEAITLCCIGKSHRTAFDREMIKTGTSSAAVQLSVERNDGTHDIGIRLFDEAHKRKAIFINGKAAARTADLIGHASCVTFSPEDLTLIKDGPSERRRYLDMLLSQESHSYFLSLSQYSNALKQRNILLKNGPLNTLDAWDEQLAVSAVKVIEHRRAAVQFLREACTRHYKGVSGIDSEFFDIRYISCLDNESDICQGMLNGLKTARAEDLRRETTTFGPHRDDLELSLCCFPIKTYASQGQMRTAALAMKLAAFDYLENSLGEPPLLLLDDVLSELDINRRKRLITRISRAQALLTCTDRTDFIGAEPACVIGVERGTLKAL